MSNKQISNIDNLLKRTFNRIKIEEVYFKKKIIIKQFTICLIKNLFLLKI